VRLLRQVREPDLDERPHRVLEAGLARHGEGLLPRLARLLRIDALLEPVVTRDEQLLNPPARFLGVHSPSLTVQNSDSRVGVMASIRVLIADDHRLFAEALEVILAGDARISVIGRAGDGREAVRLAHELDPDVVLMDISMPVMNGIEAARAIRAENREARILMLTGSNSRADVDSARRAGAAGYVTKDRIASELIDAIVEVATR
jgi:CheY-like chemotaxis protein